MIETMEQALDWLYNQPTGKRRDKTAFEKVLKKLGNPHQNSVTYVHVAGTNGKGSTVDFLANILEAHGKSVMTFTSPHLLRFNERIQWNHQPISDADLIEYVNKLQDVQLTQFELYLCLFFMYLDKKRPDVAIVEAGIGGLNDVTNMIDSRISVITSIGLDHQDMLGDTLEKIAFQKAGIIKEHKPIVVGPVDKESYAVIKQVAHDKQAPLYALKYDVSAITYNMQTMSFTFENDIYMTQMVGVHQVSNAQLALTTARLVLGEAFQVVSAQQGVAQTRWSGRMEKVADKPVTFVDGAHNPQGIQTLLNSMDTLFIGQNVRIIFGALSRKDYQSMLAILSQNHTVHVTPFDYYQSASVEELRILENEQIAVIDNWQATYTKWTQYYPDDVILFTGSLYFISEVLAYFKNENAL